MQISKTLIVIASVFFVIAIIVFALWPQCVPLTVNEVAAFQPPIEQRTDKDFYLKVFQQQNGEWCQCKTRISRAFFF